MGTEITALVRTFYDELWNRWNDAVLATVLHPDFRFRGSLGQTTVGVREWRRYRDLIRSGSRDFTNDVEIVIAAGNEAAAKLRYSGTHTGILLGLPATNRPFSYAGAAFFESDGKQLTSAWVIGDLDHLRKQLS